MKKTKFDLLFEDVMETLKKAEVTYTTLHDLVLNIIADYIDLPVEEILENEWDVDTYIATEDDIISFVNDGFSNDVTRAEAKEFANKMLIVDLERLPIDEETYNELIENTELSNKILHAVRKNGYYQIKEIFIK